MQQISLFVMRPRDEIKAGDSESMGAHIAGSDDTRGSELSCDLVFESNPSSINEEPVLGYIHTNQDPVQIPNLEPLEDAPTSPRPVLQRMRSPNPGHVETASNSPLLLPSLSADTGSVLEPDDSYINNLPKDPPITKTSTYSTTTAETDNAVPPSDAAQNLVWRSSTPQSEFLDLIPACPKRRPVSRGDWYGLPSIPNFRVCEKCYELHIYNTAFVKYFLQVKLAKDEKTFCAFNTPRVLDFVWLKTVEASLFEIFEGYAVERSKIGTCTGMDASAKPGVWYMAQGKSRGKFIACEACYHDVILATPFHQFFGPLEATVSENTTSCHVAWPFIEARLLNTTSSWGEIQRDIEYRLHMVPGCPGDKLIKDPGRRWWKPKGTSLPVYICDCCYWDGIFPTLFSGEFDLVVQDSRDEWCCAMSGYQLSTIWQYAAEKEDIMPWLDAANAALSPMCTPHRSPGRTWNVFNDPALDGIDFCERCADVFIRPLGFGKHLEKRRYSPDKNIKCDLNPTNKYQQETLQKLGEAAAWRDFGILKHYLAQLT
jgi:hypothetical protein